MILYANGCSFVSGSELFTYDHPEFADKVEPANMPNAELIRIGLSEYAEINIANAFSGVMSKRLGWELINSSQGGSGNEKIAYRTILDLTELLKKHEPSEIVVVVGWSCLHRRNYVRNYDIYSIVPGYNRGEQYIIERNDLMTTHLVNEMQLGLLKYLKAVRMVTDFCEQHKLRLVMFDSMTIGLSLEVFEALSDAVEKNRTYWDRVYETLPSFKDFFYCKPHVVTDMRSFVYRQSKSSFGHYGWEMGHHFCNFGHPGREAHIKWAELLMHHLEEH